jgi:hypothetical protein
MVPKQTGNHPGNFGYDLTGCEGGHCRPDANREACCG